MKVSVKVQQPGQIVFCRRADNGFDHVLLPRIMSLLAYYQNGLQRVVRPITSMGDSCVTRSQTRQMAARYSAKANQGRLAASAVAKLEEGWDV
jgi:hypothetical protein